jgi:hypothetical protein
MHNQITGHTHDAKHRTETKTDFGFFQRLQTELDLKLLTMKAVQREEFKTFD